MLLFLLNFCSLYHEVQYNQFFFPRWHPTFALIFWSEPKKYVWGTELYIVERKVLNSIWYLSSTGWYTEKIKSLIILDLTFFLLKATLFFPLILTSILSFKPMNLPTAKSLSLDMTGWSDPDDL